MDSGGFQLVSRKKAARCRNIKRPQVPSCSPQETKNECLEKIFNAKDVLQRSDGYSSLKKNLNSIEHYLINGAKPCLNLNVKSCKISCIVCYGLGQPSSSRISRYQTALLLLLKDHFDAPTEIFDPVMSSVDIEVLEELKVKVLSKNEEGKRRVKNATLFYLPHCGKELYNNLLWANWSASLLPSCVIIGNSFSSIVQNVPTRILKKHYQYIYQAESLFTEQPLNDLVDYDDIFNDISIHTPCSNISNKQQDFWDKSKEPVYEECDVEIVRMKTCKQHH